MTPAAPIDKKPITLAEAARLLPKRPNPATLWRWRTKGVRGVRLKTSMIGGRRYVTRAALQQFIEAVTAAASASAGPSSASESAGDNLRHGRSAEMSKRLRRAGLLAGRRKKQRA
jgi:Protein of unknown function (DUF1580)